MQAVTPHNRDGITISGYRPIIKYNDKAISSQPIILLNRSPQFISLPDLRLALHISHVHISAGENVTEIFPAQMLHQMIVIQHRIRKSISLRRHEKRGSPVMAPQEISVSFLQGKQPVTRRPELAAQVPILQRRRQHHHIALLHSRVNPGHIILLHTGTFPAAVSSETSLASVDLHPIQEEFRDRVSRALGPFGKCLYQQRGISFLPGTTI